tara:strand:- start:1083 stop:1289 length:207 start_codon:yes stop_codon:yes gene_type:complete
MGFKIQSGEKPILKSKYPFIELAINDYFDVKNVAQASMSSLCNQYSKKLGKKFTTSKQGKSIRVRREL